MTLTVWPKLSCPSLQVSAEAGHLQGLQLDRLERALAEQQRSADVELDRVQRSTREAAEVAVHTAVEEARAEMRVCSRKPVCATSSWRQGTSFAPTLLAATFAGWGALVQRCSQCTILCRADHRVHAVNLGVPRSQRSAAAAGTGPGNAFISCIWLPVCGCVHSEMGLTFPQVTAGLMAPGGLCGPPADVPDAPAGEL